MCDEEGDELKEGAREHFCGIAGEKCVTLRLLSKAASLFTKALFLSGLKREFGHAHLGHTLASRKMAFII